MPFEVITKVSREVCLDTGALGPKMREDDLREASVACSRSRSAVDPRKSAVEWLVSSGAENTCVKKSDALTPTGSLSEKTTRIQRREVSRMKRRILLSRALQSFGKQQQGLVQRHTNPSFF